MGKPRLTDKVIRGIIAATSFAHASPDDFMGAEKWTEKQKKDWADVVAADQWARGMREYRESKGKGH